MTALAANALWLAGCLPDYARFTGATLRVRAEQEAVLREVIRANSNTEFGRRHDFAGIRTVDDYRRRVPMASFENFQDDIDRAAAGQPHVLTSDHVRLFEPTSGSSGATKLIPSTISLRREFQRGIRPWIANLFLTNPALMDGQAYWSVSPPLASRQRTAAGIPIGFDDDSAYLGGWQQRMVREVMVSPSLTGDNRDLDSFRYQTLLALLRAPKLRLISIWNPSFLLLMLDRLPEWCEALGNDVGNSRRAAAVRRAAAARTAAERHQILWPDLRLISCWADANAATGAAQLAALFPHARLQGKGLIATEGFVSFPLIDHDGAALAVRSHFLEFAPLDSDGNINPDESLLAHQLEPGRRYVVVLTTGGGLYRYRLDDVLEVIGRLRQCPTVRFVGRYGHVSDWFGEKLNDAHVSRVMQSALGRCGIDVSFAMLACDTARRPPSYLLYVDTVAPQSLLDQVAADIEIGLRASFHYDCARRLGQLGPIAACRVQHGAAIYEAVAIQSGRRPGNIKPLALDRRDGWTRRFSAVESAA